jgi:hypothetical protein
MRVYGGKQWPLVAEYVGCGVTRQQCMARWTRFLRPDVVELRAQKRPWTQADVSIRVPASVFRIRLFPFRITLGHHNDLVLSVYALHCIHE